MHSNDFLVRSTLRKLRSSLSISQDSSPAFKIGYTGWTRSGNPYLTCKAGSAKLQLTSHMWLLRMEHAASTWRTWVGAPQFSDLQVRYQASDAHERAILGSQAIIWLPLLELMPWKVASHSSWMSENYCLWLRGSTSLAIPALHMSPAWCFSKNLGSDCPLPDIFFFLLKFVIGSRSYTFSLSLTPQDMQPGTNTLTKWAKNPGTLEVWSPISRECIHLVSSI